MPESENLKSEDKSVTGKLQLTRQGFGFLIPDNSEIEDIFIPEDEIGSAMNNDLLRVGLRRNKRGRGRRDSGVILEIVERALKRIVGVYTLGRHGDLCMPEDSQICEPFMLEDCSDAPECFADDKILIEITAWPEPGKRGSGFVLERLGPAGDPDTETAAILANFEAPGPFSDQVMSEVHALATNISPEERSIRADLNDLITFTIDPDTARDFDDAISLEDVNGGLLLGVHIADVSHYVTEGSLLDREARERSTSIYLPSRVIPMIPPELSNDLCSLRPQEERLALSVFVEISHDGEIGESWCQRSIIFSRHRFTYREVFDLLENDELAEVFPDKEIMSRLRTLQTLAEKLRKKRIGDGAVELVLPEFRVVVDEHSKAVGMEKVETDFSHQMIEECMLVANVAMGEFAVRQELPILYRTHEEPGDERLTELAVFLNDYGYNFKPPFTRKKINKLLEKSKGKVEEQAINLAVLRSMQQAVYSPQQLEHFALSFNHYTHFTSPIRRYPDLQLHQTLKQLFSETGNRIPESSKLSKVRSKDLSMLGTHTSGRERRAMKIEEAVKDLRKLELLAQTDKNIHRATITGIAKFGVFVELADYYVDGLLHRTELEKQGFKLVEVLPSESGEKKQRPKSKKKKNHYQKQHLTQIGVHLGQIVQVIVKSVNLAERKCILEFVGLPKDD